MLYVIVLAVLLSAVSESVFAQGPAVTTNQDVAQSNGAYRLGPTDVIKVTVLKQDLLTLDGVRVGNDGTVRLPMLAEPVKAACRTEAELASFLTEQYRKYLLNPQVFVTIKEFNANSITVIGAVTTPGRFQLQRPVRLLQVLALVNGPATTASNELQILRTSRLDFCSESGQEVPAAFIEDSTPEIIALKLNDVLNGSPDANPLLRGGDVIRVPTAELKQAFIIGSVKTATTVNLKEPVALTTAIAMSGGTVSGANLEKIKISRQSVESLKKNDIFVNLKAIRDGSRQDVLLEPNDIVEVPGPSGTKKFFKDILRTIIPAVSGFPMIIP